MKHTQSDELSRRNFLSRAARTCLGVHLFPMLGHQLADAAPANLAVTAKAKHIIYLFMSGGMSHLDTFDPKPKKKDVMGKTTTIPSKASDIFIGHYLPQTAAIMDHVCVINSMNSIQGAHEQGAYIMHTSYSMRGNVKHPTLGSWVMKMTERINPDLPGFVSIDTPADHAGGGFFGAKYSAAPIGSPSEGLQDSCRLNEVTPENFNRRLSLADQLNQQFHERYENADVRAYTELYQEATRLMNSKDLHAFNLNNESAETKKLYGSGRFAQGCMLARRLIEHGVRFVEVQLGGWDTHYDNFTAVEGRCREFDQAYAALINDLHKRGKLKDTLVVVATEFGRTPEIKTEHSLGRDHHPSAYSCLLAGGGIKGGIKHGLTDSTGSKVRKDPVTVQDFNATIAHALGLPLDHVIISPSKRPFKIADKGTPVISLFDS